MNHTLTDSKPLIKKKQIKISGVIFNCNCWPKSSFPFLSKILGAGSSTTVCSTGTEVRCYIQALVLVLFDLSAEFDNEDADSSEKIRGCY